jgi:hypothetical protein
MEAASMMSDILGIAIVVLLAVTIACPAAALIFQDAGQHWRRLRGRAAPRFGRRARRSARARQDPTLVLTRNSMPERDRRQQKRFRTCLLGTLHRAAGDQPENLCDILDISLGGARVRPVDPMPARRRITLGLRHFGRLPARVVWRHGGEMGLKFDQEPAEIMAIMKGLMPRTAFAEVRVAQPTAVH